MTTSVRLLSGSFMKEIVFELGPEKYVRYRHWEQSKWQNYHDQTLVNLMSVYMRKGINEHSIQLGVQGTKGVMWQEVGKIHIIEGHKYPVWKNLNLILQAISLSNDKSCIVGILIANGKWFSFIHLTDLFLSTYVPGSW